MNERLSQPERLSGLEQFDQAAKLFAQVAAKRRDYYGQPHFALGPDKTMQATDFSEAEFIMRQLQEARDRLEDGKLTKAENINLFFGVQARDVRYKHEFANNLVVSDLYNAFHAGEYSKGYYGLESDARVLAANGRVVHELDGLREVERTTHDQAALIDEQGQLTGVQIRFGENICVNFSLGNFGKPEVPGEITSVNLVVEPGN